MADSPARWLPGWFVPLAASLGGALAGCLLTAWVVASRPATPGVVPSGETPPGVAAAVGGSGPEVAVSMEAVRFAASSVALVPGGSVTFVESLGVPHFLAYGRWDGSRAKPAHLPAAPPLPGARVVDGVLRVGPFLQPGLYPIYCTVHPGMQTVIAVEAGPSNGS